MTSTLQQEGGRKLRLSASQVMRLAQGLYERGFITYMRTDNVTLSDEAHAAAVRATRSPSEYGPAVPVAAAEAVRVEGQERPGGPRGDPPDDAVALARSRSQGELNGQELALYRLIWQRTLASQMADATGTTVSVRLGAAVDRRVDRLRVRGVGHDDHVPRLPRGVRRGRPTTTATRGEREALLPPLADGDAGAGRVARRRRATPPRRRPATPRRRSSSASRSSASAGPSTWASIIQTIQDRGYVWKKGQALVPTWTAFAVVGLLEQHFDDLVDYEFTARIEDDLDAIAAGDQPEGPVAARRSTSATTTAARPQAAGRGEPRRDRRRRRSTRSRSASTPTATRSSSSRASTGPYVKRGDDTASVPEDLAARRADRRQGARAAGGAEERRADRRARRLPGVRQERPLRAVRAVGRRPTHLPPGLDKPKMSSLFKTMMLERITIDEAEALLQLPRTLGVDPADGQEIVANNGRYGPYVAEGQGLPHPRQRGAAAHDHARRGAADLRAAQGVPAAAASNMAANGPAARVRHRSGQRAAGRRQGRPVRRLRHRRRDERLDRQGRPDRGDAARAGLRAAGDPPRAGRGQGWSAGKTSAPRKKARRSGKPKKAAAKKRVAAKR